VPKPECRVYRHLFHEHQVQVPACGYDTGMMGQTPFYLCFCSRVKMTFKKQLDQVSLEVYI